MPGYIKKALHRFQHPKPKNPQFAPHKWNKPVFGKTHQSVCVDSSPPLNAKDTKRVQEIAGSFLYYARAVDGTMLPALTEIQCAQAAPTRATNDACNWLMDYAWTYPNAKIRYYACDMILYCDTDSAYLVMPGAKSRIAGHHYLGNHPPPPPALPNPVSTNGPILTVCKRLRNVVSSAAEAETGGTFENSKIAIPICRVLKVLGHPQPEDGTPFKMDNLVNHGFIHSNIKLKKSKTWDMRYHWLREKQTRKLFRYYWAKGLLNNADYFTKHHPPCVHIQMRPKYILKGHLLRQNILSTISSILSRTTFNF